MTSMTPIGGVTGILQHHLTIFYTGHQRELNIVKQFRLAVAVQL